MEAKRKFKVKKQVGVISCVYRKWSEWEEGDIIVGKYVNSRVDDYQKNNYIVKIEEAFFKDKKAAKDLAGKHLGLNACGSLDKAMDEVTLGDFIQVEYQGSGVVENGPMKGKDFHKVSVQILEAEEGPTGDNAEEAL